MTILMTTVGTRGDVQPILTLAMAVRDLGHDVRLCVPPNFVEQAQTLGFEARPLGIEMRAPRQGEMSPTSIPDLISDQFDVVVAAAEGCDLILGGGAHQYAARSASEIHDIPCLIAVYSPTSIPSRDVPPGRQSSFSGGAAENCRLWDQERSAWNTRALEKVNTNRHRWNLHPIDDVVSHILGSEVWLAADNVLGPAPSLPEPKVLQTGAWIMEDHRPLPSELSAFLAAGDPPVYFGFGSMPAPQSAVATLIGTAQALGRRVVLSRGWAELASNDHGSRCIVIDEVNQQALFRRVCAVVHHGGAGTTTIAARAGAPQVITPMFTDQFYWGFRLEQLKAGAAVPMSDLCPSSLEHALRQALGPETVSRAAALAQQVVSDGASTAARHLVDLVR
jgi:vancomycin aglycone glucosyltransferase